VEGDRVLLQVFRLQHGPVRRALVRLFPRVQVVLGEVVSDLVRPGVEGVLAVDAGELREGAALDLGGG
jgi:hypothetical protein